MSWETDDDCSDEDYLHFVDNVEDGTGFYCRARRFDEKSSDDMISHNEQGSYSTTQPQAPLSSIKVSGRNMLCSNILYHQVL